MNSSFKKIKYKESIDRLIYEMPEALSLNLLLDFSILFFDAYERGAECFEIIRNVNQRDVIAEILRNNLRLKDKTLNFMGEKFSQLNPECINIINHMFRGLCLEEDRFEDCSDAFQYMLSLWVENHQNTYFFTPMNLANMMVEIISPDNNEFVVDPACGSGRILAATGKQNKNLLLQGIDINSGLSILSYFNIFFSTKNDATMKNEDFLSIKKNEYFLCDIIVSNPPYKYDLNVTVNYIERIIEMLKPNGRCGILVPEGFLTSSVMNRVIRLRQRLIDSNYLDAVISLPRKIYKPYTESKSSLIILNKAPNKTDTVFMCNIPEYNGAENEFTTDVYQADMDKIVKAWKYYAGIVSEKNSDVRNVYWCTEYKEIMESDNYILSAEQYQRKQYLSTNVQYDELRNEIMETQMKLKTTFEYYNEVRL